ncbi:DUF4019 domain-containing protein [uncultured Erythrobacter sp.]|uniref:helix-turn-helix domain-containing protein n=1 Tax=uncultured Erythrobacter sp. TaxID=263913 RepID=UPI002637CE98|nr:DUF4019 domain-containing protein [uncultured Erythrobacter sp.]
MTTSLDRLTDKENETLRLIARGHDAKSAARELGISVHTINERLRNSRRKLGVTSSREAARKLVHLETEAAERAGENIVYEEIGDANPTAASDPAAIVKKSSDRALWIGGIAVMSAIALAVVVTLLGAPNLEAPNVQGSTAQLAQVDAAPEEAARAWLALVDDSDWQASYEAAGAAFRTPNTVEGWQAASQEVRTPLGSVTAREAIKTEFVNAPPYGFTLVRFLTKFENGGTAIETVTLEREADGLRVVGYLIE